MKQKLFTITTADLREERYRGSGAGGQNRNKRDTGVRFTHEPSGAVGESESQRSQLQNRQEAFRKMAASPRFIMWAKAQGQARIDGHANLERKINGLMADDNLKVELGTDCHGRETFCDKAPKD